MFSDWLVRDFEPDLAARFHTAVSEARRERTAALLGRGGRRVTGSLGKPVRGHERAAGRGAALGVAFWAKSGASF